MAILQLTITYAKKQNERAYLQADCKNDTLKKKKLLVEITKKQSKDYQSKMRAIMREAEKQVAHGTKFLALKEWAKNRRRDLLG